MFWKKKISELPDKSKIIIAMIMLSDQKSFDPETLKTFLKSRYNVTLNDVSGDSETLAFNISNSTVVIGHMPVPVPREDIWSTSQYAYNWPTAIEELAGQKSHLLVTFLESEQDQVERYKTLTQVVCTLLQTTNALGVYMGSQSLLHSTGDYLNAAENMDNDQLPISLWIYFGVRPGQDKNSVYTYGLKEFGRNELEIIDSSSAIEEVINFMYSTTHYLLESNVKFEHGQTIGFSEEQKIKIILSKGKFVAGETFKMVY